jgi:hypothetical protein
MKNSSFAGRFSMSQTAVFLGILAGISIAVYLIWSNRLDQIGFPLDDAWIHQTYARNLAFRGEWAFIPGQASAGSTSPLWSAILAIGFRLNLAPFGWTFFLGWVALAGIGLTGMWFLNRIRPSNLFETTLVGVILILEWHLVWAAVSGMETLLFAWLVVFFFGALIEEKRHWLSLGILTGISIWLRPDGLTLAGPALFVALSTERSSEARFMAVARYLIGLVLLFLPYFIFNQLLSGTWWPNTFFAKQAEYAVSQQIPFLMRFFREVGLILIGAEMLLLPGLIIISIKAVQRKEWALLAMVIWIFGFVMIYAIRLPVLYQHGRYVIPVMPVYIIISLAGLFSWLKPREPKLLKRVFGKAWVISLMVTAFAFWLIGARAYANDVAVIESEMVATAHWISRNTEPSALIAAHDIGALGYFGKRRILDLAGLVSPEVIPFIRDEDRLAEWMDAEGADYLMTFPSWYPQLIKQGNPIYNTHGKYSPLQGGENMLVYRWR